MIIDKLLSPVINKNLVDFTVATHTLGTAMDFGVARNNGLLATPYGPGWEINVRDATSGGAATATLSLLTDDNAAMGSPTTLWTSGSIALASLVKYDNFVPIPSLDTWERWVAWRLVVGTAVFTAGVLDIEYVANRRDWRAYPAQGNR